MHFSKISVLCLLISVTIVQNYVLDVNDQNLIQIPNYLTQTLVSERVDNSTVLENVCKSDIEFFKKALVNKENWALKS